VLVVAYSFSFLACSIPTGLKSFTDYFQSPALISITSLVISELEIICSILDRSK